MTVVAASSQTLIPIIRSATKTIVGILQLGSFVKFRGTETSYTLPSTVVVPIQQWVPDTPPRADKAPWVMAMVIADVDYVSNAYRGYAEFLPLEAVLPAIQFNSAGGLPNRVVETPGSLLDLLSSKSETTMTVVAVATPSPLAMVLTHAVATDTQPITVKDGNVVSLTVTGTIPPGLLIDAVVPTGIRIHGTPTTAGSSSVVVNLVTDNGNIALTVNFTIA